jgi:hypothetical protein
MIPKDAKRRAAAMTVAAFGLMAIGTVLGLLWISVYAPK